MPITATVRGDKELGEEMVKFAQGMNMDMKRVVPIAAFQAAKMGKRLCPPGEKLRKVVTRKSNTPTMQKPYKEATDTSRQVRHFIMFRRQNKPAYFVPISPISTSNDFQKPTDKQELKDWNKARGKAKKNYQKPWRKGQGAYTYGRRANRNDGGTGNLVHRYDSPSDIASMRKIGRRGLAGELWASLGNGIKGGGKIAVKTKGAGVGTVNKNNKDAIQRHARKWGEVHEHKQPQSMRIVLKNKLTYVTNAFGNIEPRIMRDAANSMENEMKNRLIRRAKALEKQARAS